MGEEGCTREQCPQKPEDGVSDVLECTCGRWKLTWRAIAVLLTTDEYLQHSPPHKQNKVLFLFFESLIK